MSAGKRLKVKLRSGTCALGIELKRWTRRDDSGKCKCCDLDCIEDPFHFVAVCPKFVDERNKLKTELLEIFTTDGVQGRNFIKVCCADNDRFLKLILARCFSFSKEIVSQVFSKINAFLAEIYVVRNTFIFSPLNGNVGSGADDSFVMAK